MRDDLDDRLHDAVALDEIDLFADVLSAVAAADGPLTDDEIAALVATTIGELGVRGDGIKAMGRVMGTITPQVKGRADGGAVSAEVRRQLG